MFLKTLLQNLNFNFYIDNILEEKDMEYRIERDSMGEMQVPADRY